MLVALHTLIYSDDPPATRAFVRDVLRLPYVDESEALAWPIFRTGPSELGVHPTSGAHEGETYEYPRHHSISLVCDDLSRTMQELESRGATFAGDVQDFGFGRGVMLGVPGADALLLYEPRHATAYDL